MSDRSIIALKSCDIVINDQDIHDYSMEDTNIKDLIICECKLAEINFPSSSLTVSAIISSSADNDYVGNTSLATLEVYELHEDIKSNHHRPKVFPKMKPLQRYKHNHYNQCQIKSAIISNSLTQTKDIHKDSIPNGPNKRTVHYSHHVKCIT